MELFPGQSEPLTVKQVDAGLHRHLVPDVVLSDEDGVTDRGSFDERLRINTGGSAHIAVVNVRPHVVEDLVVGPRNVDEIALLREVELLFELRLVVPFAHLGTDLGEPDGHGGGHVAALIPPGQPVVPGPRAQQPLHRLHLGGPGVLRQFVEHVALHLVELLLPLLQVRLRLGALLEGDLVRDLPSVVLDGDGEDSAVPSGIHGHRVGLRGVVDPGPVGAHRHVGPVGAAVAVAAPVLAVRDRPEAGGVGLGDRGVVGVGVAVEGLVVVGGEDGVDGEEASGDRVVLAGADVGEAGGVVGGFAEEALVVGPGRRCRAAALAEGLGVAAGDGLCGGVDRHRGGAVVVVDHPGQAGLGADGDGVAGGVVALGGELLGGRVVVQFLAGQVEDGLVGAPADQEVAVGVVEVVGRLGAFGEAAEFSFDVPDEALRGAGGAVALGGVAVLVVGVRLRRAAAYGDRGHRVGLAGAVGVDGDRVSPVALRSVCLSRRPPGL